MTTEINVKDLLVSEPTEVSVSMSPQVDEFAAALAKAQGLFKPLKKNKTVDAGRMKYNYADLAEVIEATKEALSQNGLAVLQFPSTSADKVYITTMLIHSSGQWMSSILSAKAVNMTPQTIGSVITYLKRYARSSILGVAADDDDDANIAENKDVSINNRPRTQPQPQPQPQEEQPTVEIFNRDDANHTRRIEKLLLAMKIDHGYHLRITEALHGHPLTRGRVEDLVKHLPKAANA